jgi:hypothetical protein
MAVKMVIEREVREMRGGEIKLQRQMAWRR